MSKQGVPGHSRIIYPASTAILPPPLWAEHTAGVRDLQSRRSPTPMRGSFRLPLHEHLPPLVEYTVERDGALVGGIRQPA
jgi:hypothetical protein